MYITGETIVTMALVIVAMMLVSRLADKYDWFGNITIASPFLFILYLWLWT